MESIELPQENFQEEIEMIVPKIIIEIENDIFKQIISEIPLEVYIKLDGVIIEETVDVISNNILVQNELND